MSKRLTVISLAVFVGLFFSGIWLSTKKPVWNDEIYTQTNTVEKSSVKDILTVKFEEGNSSPLFYLIQKGFQAVLGYHFPQKWNGEWEIEDLWTQTVMRLPANFFMSLALTAMFWFFAREYSLGAGLFALVTGLSSYMAAAYWLEARPYSLWFLLTTLLCLVFLRVCYRGKVTDRDLGALAVLYLLLSFTVIFGALQIVCFSLFLILIDRSRARAVLAVSVLPGLICAAYYVFSPKFKFFFREGAGELIGASIPQDRMLMLAVYAAACLFAWGQAQNGRFKIFPRPDELRAKMFLGLTGLTLAAALAVLAVFRAKADPGHAGFMISNRYFIFLAPVGAVAVTISVIEILRALKGRVWLQGGFLAAAGALTVFRIYRTVILAREVYHF